MNKGIPDFQSAKKIADTSPQIRIGEQKHSTPLPSIQRWVFKILILLFPSGISNINTILPGGGGGGKLSPPFLSFRDLF